MKSSSPYLPAAITTLAIVTLGHAAPIVVTGRDGFDTGGGGTNQHNSPAWNTGATVAKPAHIVGTVLTTCISGNSDGVTPQTWTYNVVDTNTGTDFDFTITVNAWWDDGAGTYIETTKRNGGVRSPGGTNAGRDFTEHTTELDGHEYMRTTVDTGSIVINSGPQVYFTGWNAAFVKTSTVDGAIRQAGTTAAPGTGPNLATWALADGTGPLELALTTDHTVPSLDWVATSDSAEAHKGFKAFGFILNFDTEAPVPDTFPLTITPATSPDTGYDLEWPTQAGMLYRVLNNTGLGTPIDTWTLVEGDIAATPPSNSYNVDPGDPSLFYAVEEYPAPPPPPLIEENFDAGALLPVGWTSNGPSNGTDWEVGIPSGVASGPTAANSAPNCAGTNIGAYYTENADVSLTSPSIAIPVDSGATLSFRQFIDTDLTGSPNDLGSVRILDADNADTPIAGLEITGIEGDGLAGWTEEMLDLPALDVGGKNIKVEFRFVSNAGTVPDLDVWGGFYVDDVVVTQD